MENKNRDLPKTEVCKLNTLHLYQYGEILLKTPCPHETKFY